MGQPILELEGTWEEIACRASEFAGRKVRLTIFSDEPNTEREEDPRSIEEKLAAIAAQIAPEEWAKLPEDFTDQLDHYIYGAPKR